MSTAFEYAVTRRRSWARLCKNGHEVCEANAAGWALERGLYRCARCFEEYAKHRKPTVKPGFVETDAGRAAVKPHETNDCTVRALAKAADLPYAEAHALLEAAGRKNCKGISMYCFLAGRKTLGKHKVVPVVAHTFPERFPNQPKTLGQFIAAFPVGRYLVTRRHHAFAVVDGVVYDKGYGDGPRRKVLYAWQLVPEVTNVQ